MFKSWQKLFILVLGITLVLTISPTSHAASGDTIRVSLATVQANDASTAPDISANGRYVAFYSPASNLVSEDTNVASDVFLSNTQTGTTSCVSLATDRTEANDTSYNAAISADGRYLAFQSLATNLVNGDANGAFDIFMHDTQTDTTSRVSRATNGTEGNDDSYNPAISANGRYVTFYSHATNLVSGDANEKSDVFVHDTQTGTTSRVSRATNGTEGNGHSTAPSISDNGRFITFSSLASNIVSGDSNGAHDIFLHDTQIGITSRVSLAMGGTQGNASSFTPAISADGRYVAFRSHASNLTRDDTNGWADIFVHDTQSRTTRRVSLTTDGVQGNSRSYNPTISDDGRYVAFSSYASNLVSGDTNGRRDVFVHDTRSGTTNRISLASDGTQGNGDSSSPAISADGRYVAFVSHDSNLVSGDTNGEDDIFVHDTYTGTTSGISLASDGTQGNDMSLEPAISADGRYVTFSSKASNLVSGDTNGESDVFVHDTHTGTTSRVSIATDGTQGNEASSEPAISADGRYVAFSSYASTLVSGNTNGTYHIFVHDTHTDTTSRVSLATDGTQGNDMSYEPAISADGRYVTFVSHASNLVSGDTNGMSDVFVHDTQSSTTSRVSLATDGTQGNGWSSEPTISADGRYVAFASHASNLVSGDSNEMTDIFVHDTYTGTTSGISLASDGTQGNEASSYPAISADGRYVAFGSYASNLVSGDTNGECDIFVHDTQIGTTSRVSLATDGTQGNDQSSSASAISADGRYVTFSSDANNLVSGDTNERPDIFVHDTQSGTTSRNSLATDGTQGNGWSSDPAISIDGRYVAFSSTASNLVSGDTNRKYDIFVHENEAYTALSRVYLPLVLRNTP